MRADVLGTARFIINFLDANVLRHCGPSHIRTYTAAVGLAIRDAPNYIFTRTHPARSLALSLSLARSLPPSLFTHRIHPQHTPTKKHSASLAGWREEQTQHRTDVC